MLYRTTLKPRPSTGSNTFLMYSLRAVWGKPPTTLAHQASDVPHPCSVWYWTEGSTNARYSAEPRAQTSGRINGNTARAARRPRPDRTRTRSITSFLENFSACTRSADYCCVGTVVKARRGWSVIARLDRA